ncbi:MAG: RNA 2',3'-cyclic phosphodiesterase [Verrucomicrobia subdivision 3 bacterium]|nr:RNA 2',3'-cyclic phosphodiesterase [Limisphaerales bacterium]
MTNDTMANHQHVRAFVAIHIPQEIRDLLQGLQTELQSAMPPEAVRWTPVEQIHLTLEFLGNVPGSEIDALTAGLRGVAVVNRNVALGVEAVGAFPSTRRPGVIWAGINGQIDNLIKLQADVRRAVARWRTDPETRAYHPHATLGRVREIRRRDLRSVSRALIGASRLRFGQWTAQEFALMQSSLSSEGAKHSVLATFPLRGVQA